MSDVCGIRILPLVPNCKSPVRVNPEFWITVLENVVDAANVAAALTVKESAASSPIVALPEDVKLSIERAPLNTGDIIVLFSIVCVDLSVNNSSVLLVISAWSGNVYTFITPGVKLVTLNLATFVSSIEFGI